MKKFLILIIMFVFIIPIFDTVYANNDNRTLQDLIDELNVKKKKLDEVNNDKTMTENRIKDIKNNIISINNEIAEIEVSVEKLNLEIIALNLEIKAKDAEVKKIVNYHQLSNGDDNYIEYVMGSADVTDFILRVSVVEQLANHNKNLINNMNDMIVASENKTKELQVHKSNISVKKELLYKEQFKLGDRVDDLSDHALSLSKEIEDAIKTIDNYKKFFNCKPSQKLKDCASYPVDTSFARPLESGRVTSNFGWRIHPTLGYKKFHSGIDVGSTPSGTKLFAPAAGKVVFTGFYSCGGNYMILQHNVNGKPYATRFMHLSSIDVKVGQTVNKLTVIAKIGGGESYDTCSTGPHMHFDVARGVYGQDFYSFSQSGPLIDPRSVVSFPALGASFSGR